MDDFALCVVKGSAARPSAKAKGKKSRRRRRATAESDSDDDGDDDGSDSEDDDEVDGTVSPAERVAVPGILAKGEKDAVNLIRVKEIIKARTPPRPANQSKRPLAMVCELGVLYAKLTRSLVHPAQGECPSVTWEWWCRTEDATRQKVMMEPLTGDGAARTCSMSAFPSQLAMSKVSSDCCDIVPSSSLLLSTPDGLQMGAL